MKTEWKFSLPCLLVLLYFLIPLRSLASNHRLALLLIGGNVLLIFLTVFLPILAARLHAKHGGESPVGVAFIVVGIGAVALTLLFSFSGATFVLNDVVILFICLLFAVGIVGAYVVKRAAQRARDAAASVAPPTGAAAPSEGADDVLTDSPAPQEAAAPGQVPPAPPLEGRQDLPAQGAGSAPPQQAAPIGPVTPPAAEERKAKLASGVNYLLAGLCGALVVVVCLLLLQNRTLSGGGAPLIGWASSPAADAAVEYRSAGLSISVPQKWDAETLAGTTDMYMFYPAPSTALTISYAPLSSEGQFGPAGIADAVDEAFNRLIEPLQRHEIKSVDKAEINGWPWLRYEYTGLFQDYTWRYVAYITAHGQDVHVVSYMAQKTLFDDAKTEFEAAVQTLSFD